MREAYGEAVWSWHPRLVLKLHEGKVIQPGDEPQGVRCNDGGQCPGESAE